MCLNTFLSCPYRVEVATNLERSLQQGRDLLSTYENKLVIDDTVPEDLKVVDRKKEELLVSFLPCSHAARAKPLSKSCGDSCSTHKLGSVGDRVASPSWGRELTLTAVIPTCFKHKHLSSPNQIKSNQIPLEVL